MEYGLVAAGVRLDLEPRFLMALGFVAFCAWISLSMILRLWLVHTRASRGKKIRWTLVLLVPFFGWLCYGALFRVPSYNPNQCPNEHSRGVGYIGGGYF